MAPIVEVNKPPRTMLDRWRRPLLVVGVALSLPAGALLSAFTIRSVLWVLGMSIESPGDVMAAVLCLSGGAISFGLALHHATT